MKIEKVKAIVVNAEMRNWIFVKVETDVDGLHGWGEASLEWKTRSVVGAVADFEPMLVGEDPTRIEHLYQKMYRQSFGGRESLASLPSLPSSRRVGTS